MKVNARSAIFVNQTPFLMQVRIAININVMILTMLETVIFSIKAGKQGGGR